MEKTGPNYGGAVMPTGGKFFLGSRIKILAASAGIFKQIMGARNRVGIGCRTDQPGYTALRNWFLGTDSGAP